MPTRGYASGQLVSKIFNLRGPDPPTSQTDGQTDDMRSQDRALHYSALHGKNTFDNTPGLLQDLLPVHKSDEKVLQIPVDYSDFVIKGRR